MKFHPDDFIVNHTWIAIRFNESFIYGQNEPHDGHVLMDAGSCYVFGFAFSKTTDISPPKKEVQELFKKAYSVKKEWAKELMLPEKYPAGTVFAEYAQKLGMTVTYVDESDLDLIVGELKQSFGENFC